MHPASAGRARWRAMAAGLLLCAAPACARGDAAARPAGGGMSTRAADAAIRRAMADPAQWAGYGRDYSNQRWSPLTQINTGNVASLAPAWVYHTGIVNAFETSPVVVDGTMYLSTQRNHVVALDASSGRKKWEYTHPYATTVDCCGPINRGVAVYGGRVFMGTVDARLVALDAGTGRKLWQVQVGDNQKGYHITSAPLAAEGLVVTGISCGEQGGRCYVTAYDAATGKLAWRWYTVPSPEQGGWWGKWKTTDPFGTPIPRDIEQEKRDSAKYPNAWLTGGAPMWHTPAYEPETGLLFMNVGNPAPDLDGTVRPGDNLYTDCIVAVELKTGRLRWYQQLVPHDQWDYDPASPVVLVDVKDTRGRTVPAVAEAGKTAWVYVLDRRTGAPIRRSEAFAPQQNMWTVPTEEGVVIAPATLGGSDWSPPAFDPRTGYLYVVANYFPQLYKQKHEPLQAPAVWWGGSVTAPPAGQYGLFNAIDLNTGRIVWQHRLEKPTIGGAVATAGGVVFTGTSDRKFIAFDSRTGQPLWQATAGAGVNAPPITYQVGGTQYVAVAAGGNLPLNSPRGDEVLVFKLGSKPASGAIPTRDPTPNGGG
ncbi:MAG TPA: PQQ-binding-like beta-propeller repeat protein [Longimicrobium sp.]|nr:PQQ-binding-like beta-propeller repeat protein [Longimicrobium sp.]